jgi:hypothetical protein
MEAMKAAELDALEGPLQRHEISHDDHPLSLGSKSVWHQFFQVLYSITLLLALYSNRWFIPALLFQLVAPITDLGCQSLLLTTAGY